MTLEKCAAHVGHPVLVRTRQGRTADAEITAVNEATGMVHVRARRKQAPYDWLPGVQRWHPAHLHLPQWWIDRQEAASCPPGR